MQTHKHMSLRRFATLWDCEADYVRDGPYVVALIEPLDVDVPPNARPTCWGIAQITFYDKKGGRKLAEGIQHHDLMGVGNHHVLLDDGRWYEVTGGHCEYRDGRWCMVWRAARNSGSAHMLNAGFWAYHNYFSVHWLVRNLCLRVRYAVIERLVRLDQSLARRGWRSR